MATSINHDQMGSVYGFQSIHIKKWGLKHVLDTSIYDSKSCCEKAMLISMYWTKQTVFAKKCQWRILLLMRTMKEMLVI